MAEREALERRVYRLAVLLTGDPLAATRVIRAVLEAQPELEEIDSAHLDRLTVLRSREVRPATIAVPDAPRAAVERLATLSPQQREAWVFTHVYRMPEREMARAMDCSVTATRNHLVVAEEQMAGDPGAGEAPGDGTEQGVARALLRWVNTLDVPEFYREAERRRAHLRTVATVVVGTIIMTVVIAAGWWVYVQFRSG